MLEIRGEDVPGEGIRVRNHEGVTLCRPRDAVVGRGSAHDLEELCEEGGHVARAEGLASSWHAGATLSVLTAPVVWQHQARGGRSRGCV